MKNILAITSVFLLCGGIITPLAASNEVFQAQQRERLATSFNTICDALKQSFPDLPTTQLSEIKTSISEFPDSNNPQKRAKNYLTEIFNEKLQDIFTYNLDFKMMTHVPHEIIRISSTLDYQQLDNTVETLKAKNDGLTIGDIMDTLRPLQDNESTPLSFPQKFNFYIGNKRQNVTIKNPTIPGIYILSKLKAPYFITYNEL